MLESFKAVLIGGQGEIIEKKSRFIANVRPVSSEEEAVAFLEQIRKQYYDARHNCFAYCIGTVMPINRLSDDGEPSQTAGKPILEVIAGKKLHNTMVVVTRYFGGTLLGTGGLVRAYTKAAQEGLLNSVIIEKKLAKRMRMTTNYTDMGKIQYFLTEEDIHVESIDYTDNVVINTLIPVGKELEIKKQLTQVTSARIKMEELEIVYYAVRDKKTLIFT